ncbi:MAG: transketolase [bacterium]|nr:transketolase [bacterium]
MNLKNIPAETLSTIANTIRIVSAEGVQRANSGHPGMPMGLAEVALVLWLKYLHIDPSDPKWLNRDRFVLSNGHGSMLLYTMLHLSGFDVSINDLKNFRQSGSKTPGHPEYRYTPGVECTTGPLGQGISNAVGMALAEKMMAARYNTAEENIFSHRTFCILGDGCLMEGVSSEASSLAGHLGLGNLIAIWDDNHISIAGRTSLTFTEDVLARYEAYGWQVLSCDGHDVQEIDEALGKAVAETGKPSLIAARTIIGKGSPNKQDSSHVHGSPLGKEELQLTKEALGFAGEEDFYIPDTVREIFSNKQETWLTARANWNKQFSNWQNEHPVLANELTQRLEITVPDDLEDQLLAGMTTPANKAVATRQSSSEILQTLGKIFPALVGGSADLEPSTLTVLKGEPAVSKDNFTGRNIHFGVREHAMGAIMNGLSYYGGFMPFGSTFFCFADYMRPTIRLAALSHLPGLFIFTHDSIFLGEDGPTHQPIEHLASLRCMPGVVVFRPASSAEVAVSYAEGMRRKTSPTIIVLTRQALPPLETDCSINDIRKGAYVAFETDSGTTPEIVFVATGSEVSLAIEAAKQFANARVVSMLCLEYFQRMDLASQQKLIPAASRKVVVEAGSPFGWQSPIASDRNDVLVLGIDRFGASAPAEVLAAEYGFNVTSVVEAVRDTFYR